MSRQKQPFRFRLPWLPSLVSAPVPPRRSSSSQRNRKAAPSPPSPPPNADSVGSNTITIQRGIEQLEGESPAQATWPLAQTESQTPLPKTDVQYGLPLQLNQKQLAEAGSLRSRTDSQSPSKKVEAASREEPTEFHIHLSGTDTESTQMQPPNISSAQGKESSDQATQSLGAKSQLLPKTESPSPPTIAAQPPSPTKESKPLSPSQGAKLIKSKSHSTSSAIALQKPSPTRAKSPPLSPSHTSILTRANSKPLSASNVGSHARSTPKQPSPSHVASLPPVPARTVNSVKTSSSKSSLSSSLSKSSLSSSSSLSSPSPHVQPTSSPTTMYSPHAKTSKPKTHASHVYHEHKSKLPQEEINQPDATKSIDLEAIRANNSNTPVAVYDKITPEPPHALETKEVTATRFMEHPSTEEASDAEEDESQWPARNKRKRKVFLKRVSSSSRDSHENRLMARNSHMEERQSSVPLHKGIKNDVADFIKKLNLDKLSQSRSEDHPVTVSIINISGDNKGAILHLNGKAPSHMTPANSDSDGTEHGDLGTKHEHQTRTACINSNIQSINNSILLSSSVHERNPGVHLGTLGKNSKSAEPKRKELASSSKASHKTEVNVTTARKLEYKPIVKRRCLRGLLMESSESDADNPDKPRRHGCRVACADKGKYDF